MKRTQVIRITPTRKKKLYEQDKKIFFNKLAKNTMNHLYKFFNEEEQLILLTLNKKFKSIFFEINSLDEKDPINSFKYMILINNLKKNSKGFIQYINILLNINIININSECLGIKTLFLEKFYKETNNNNFLIQINEKEDFNKYYSVLNSIDSEIRKKLRYDLEISKSIDIKGNNDIILKLFNLISFKNVNPFNEKNKTKLVEIQNYYIENNIKSEHKYIWSQKQSSIDNAKKYFISNKNCLLGINTMQSISLSENNIESINIINIPSFALSEFNYPEIKFKKIKFSYPSEEFNQILLNNIKFDNLEQISGLIITKNNKNDFIKKLNDLTNLKKITRIKFGSMEEEEENDDNFEEFKKELFIDFFNGIKNKHSENLVEISTWFYTFKKGKDYEFILNNFPNMRKIQEDYDSSGMYDQRFEIDKIFSCNAENPFKENDLLAITKLVKNYIKQKKGDNSIKFDLYYNYERLGQLFEYWNKNKENEIFEKINYINFIVEPELNGNELIELNKINNINLINENKCLIQLLKNTKIVNQVIVKEKSIFEKNIEFFMNKDIISIVWNKEDFSQNDLDNLLKIKSIKYFIIDDKISSENKNLSSKNIKFKIIPKKYYIDTPYKN